ncbi:MAG: molybdopterin molybdotransferase MoeA [Nitrospiria bacterium]
MPEDDPIQSARKCFFSAFSKDSTASETLPLGRAKDRVLASDLEAAIDDPPYGRSIMEGYVAYVSDLEAASESAPVTLEVAGAIPVGQGHAEGLAEGKVLQVNTGSFIPQGGFGVLRAWDVEQQGKRIIVSKPLKKKENIEVQGEIRAKGTPLLGKGHRVNSDDIFLLASQGMTEVSVACRPKVALFSSGNEVIPPDAPFQVGGIWDCNQYGLASLIEEAGGIPEFKGIMKDDFSGFVKALKAALETADMIVISGGTVAENRAFSADLLDAVGPPGTVVQGIPMRSGKPIVLGVSGGKPIVCVAGHPPEAARGFRLFGLPAIEYLMGK